MIDYIKRSDALNFDMSIECEPDELSAVMEGMARVMDYIKQIPVADVVEVVHGKWEYDLRLSQDGKRWMHGFACTNCGEFLHKEFNYCPTCLAKMDGGDHDAAD